jgi:MEMO1 family protein
MINGRVWECDSDIIPINPINPTHPINPTKNMIRTPAVAGMFYPTDPVTLKKDVVKYINGADGFDLPNLKALICPHAGYPYSGPIAGYAYRQLKNLKKKPSRIFLIGPSHYAYIESSIGNFGSYTSPLGASIVNRRFVETIEEEGIPSVPEAHKKEHSLEVQLPFLQLVAPDAEIIPILCGSVSPDYLAEKLDKYFKMPDCFFIISSDLSHHLPYEEAELRDKNSLKIIEFLDIKNEDQIDACGEVGVKTIMRLSKNNGYKIKLLDYRNSGDTAGDKSDVVGYGALAVHKPN